MYFEFSMFNSFREEWLKIETEKDGRTAPSPANKQTVASPGVIRGINSLGFGKRRKRARKHRHGDLFGPQPCPGDDALAQCTGKGCRVPTRSEFRNVALKKSNFSRTRPLRVPSRAFDSPDARRGRRRFRAREPRRAIPSLRSDAGRCSVRARAV
ncbi:hypothetical protein EVAR_39048_1 [Eumeta japonica]|uniref:Uncharacterized protein n=1 Tax=Eumeta variegata TaxID=151549 RepID=A0A4C1WM46_EUMVA|nr:hypothetical protein EVAR_39048_1 [Eumeta japonica]